MKKIIIPILIGTGAAIITCMLGFYYVWHRINSLSDIKPLLKQAKNICHMWDNINMRINIDTLENKIGRPYAIIKYYDNSQILYYKGPNPLTGNHSFTKLNELNNLKIIKKKMIYEEYDYYEFYLNPKEELEAFTHYGESLNVESIYGNIKGSPLCNYLNEKQKRRFSEIIIAEHGKETVFKLMGESDKEEKIDDSLKISFYQYYPLNEFSLLRMITQEGVEGGEKVAYSVVIDQDGFVKTKIDYIEEIGYFKDEEIRGYDNIQRYLENIK